MGMNGLVLIAVVASIFGAQAAPQDSNTDKPSNSVTAQAGRFSLGYNQGQGLSFGYNQQPPQPPQWGYPSYPSYYPGGYYQPPGGSYYQPQTKPNYNQDSDSFKPPESGIVIEDANSNTDTQPSYPDNSQMGVPSWSQSFTPMPGSGGCYNRCRPRCNFRPPPPPPPPMPMPRPQPQPQCRQVC